MLSQFGLIFTTVLLPILLIVGLGALVQRFYPMHVPTLSRLNIYLFVPAFLFIRVYESRVSFADLGAIVGAMVAPLVILGVPLYLFLRRRRADGPTVAAVIIGGLVYNAGNFGIPVAQLTYEVAHVWFPGMKQATDGEAIQALVVMFSNLCIWLLGYAILTLAKGDGIKGALGYFKLPMLYVLVAAFALRYARDRWSPGHDLLPQFVSHPLRLIADGMVPVALLTLGAQLATRVRWPRWRVLGPVLALKLLVLPAVTAGVVWAMGLWPWPGAELIIAAAAPTAVNTLLLTLELDGDADLAADCVFWTTLVSSVTVTIVLATVVRVGAVPAPG